jgi:hypothetical protein
MTPGRTLPVVSFTVPEMLPPTAHHAVELRRITTRDARNTFLNNFILDLSPKMHEFFPAGNLT